VSGRRPAREFKTYDDNGGYKMKLSDDAVRMLERMNAQRSLSEVIGDDADIHSFFRSNALSYTDFHSAESVEMRRCHVRYLAALFPKASLLDLTDVIYDVLDNSHITRQDLRLILAGYSLSDASRRLQDTPIEVVQKVGEMLSEGSTTAEIARTIRVSEDTVYRIDRFLGLSDAWRQRKVAEAADAVRDGLSVRAFGRKAGVSKSTAHRLMQQARGVLVELGEVEA
jgi:transposase-like protein